MSEFNFKKFKSCLYKAIPKHTNYLNKRFVNITKDEEPFIDLLSQLIFKICETEDNLKECILDYDWLTQEVLKEEIYFRRNKSYRLSSLQDAIEQVYSNHDYMKKYMNGLLISQIVWKNHTTALQFLVDKYYSISANAHSHLEIGPGHGLLLYLADRFGSYQKITTWDISDTSLEATRHALHSMGSSSKINYVKQDLMNPPQETFDSIVFSEVLEHLEEPQKAMHIISSLLNNKGYAFIHAPVNSPAADHISLFRTPEEVVEIVRNAGLNVVETLFAPITGHSLEEARKKELSISCVVIAQKQ